MSSVVTDQSECLNCSAPLQGTFCAQCGQKVGHPNPTFHDLLHDLTHELLHVDGRLWSSMRLLFTKPGLLTREHVLGRRAAHLPPLRLYLICSVVYFAITAVAPSNASIQMHEGRGRVVALGGVKISGEDVIGDLSDEEIGERIHKAQHDWLPKLFFALVPVWALMVKLVTWREHRNFPEHLYFALHVNAFIFALMTVAAVLRFAHSDSINAVWAVLTLLLFAWYLVVGLRVVYGGSIAVAVRRTAALLCMYFFVLIIAFGGFVILALRT